MGEGTTRLTDHPPEQIERDIERLRENIAHIAGEIDRRRHEIVDWRLQARRHAALLTAGGALIAVVASGAAGIAVWRTHRRARPEVKRQRLERAMERMAESPDDVARPEPSILKKAAAAVVSTVAATLAKRFVGRLLSEGPRPMLRADRALPPPR